MSNLTIKTNNHFRPILHGFELTEKEQSEFDWIDFSVEGEGFYGMFFRYKRQVYCLDNFMRLAGKDAYGDWHGVNQTSAFSGILVRLSDDGEGVVVGTYYS
jgi:hypothetical protein